MNGMLPMRIVRPTGSSLGKRFEATVRPIRHTRAHCFSSISSKKLPSATSQLRIVLNSVEQP